MKNLLFSKSRLALVLVVFPLMMPWQSSFAFDTAKSEALPLEDLRLFAEIFNMIKSDYVEAVDDATLLQNAVRGMLYVLDPHSAFGFFLQKCSSCQ